MNFLAKSVFCLIYSLLSSNIISVVTRDHDYQTSLSDDHENLSTHSSTSESSDSSPPLSTPVETAQHSTSSTIENMENSDDFSDLQAGKLADEHESAHPHQVELKSEETPKSSDRVALGSEIFGQHKWNTNANYDHPSIAIHPEQMSENALNNNNNSMNASVGDISLRHFIPENNNPGAEKPLAESSTNNRSNISSANEIDERKLDEIINQNDRGKAKINQDHEPKFENRSAPMASLHLEHLSDSSNVKTESTRKIFIQSESKNNSLSETEGMHDRLNKYVVHENDEKNERSKNDRGKAKIHETSEPKFEKLTHSTNSSHLEHLSNASEINKEIVHENFNEITEAQRSSANTMKMKHQMQTAAAYYASIHGGKQAPRDAMNDDRNLFAEGYRNRRENEENIPISPPDYVSPRSSFSSLSSASPQNSPTRNLLASPVLEKEVQSPLEKFSFQAAQLDAGEAAAVNRRRMGGAGKKHVVKKRRNEKGAMKSTQKRADDQKSDASMERELKNGLRGLQFPAGNATPTKRTVESLLNRRLPITPASSPSHHSSSESDDDEEIGEQNPGPSIPRSKLDYHSRVHWQKNHSFEQENAHLLQFTPEEIAFFVSLEELRTTGQSRTPLTAEQIHFFEFMEQSRKKETVNPAHQLTATLKEIRYFKWLEMKENYRRDQQMAYLLELQRQKELERREQQMQRDDGNENSDSRRFQVLDTILEDDREYDPPSRQSSVKSLNKLANSLSSVHENPGGSGATGEENNLKGENMENARRSFDSAIALSNKTGGEFQQKQKARNSFSSARESLGTSTEENKLKGEEKRLGKEIEKANAISFDAAIALSNKSSGKLAHHKVPTSAAAGVKDKRWNGVKTEKSLIKSSSSSSEVSTEAAEKSRWAKFRFFPQSKTPGTLLKCCEADPVAKSIIDPAERYRRRAQAEAAKYQNIIVPTKKHNKLMVPTKENGSLFPTKSAERPLAVESARRSGEISYRDRVNKKKIELTTTAEKSLKTIGKNDLHTKSDRFTQNHGQSKSFSHVLKDDLRSSHSDRFANDRTAAIGQQQRGESGRFIMNSGRQSVHSSFATIGSSFAAAEGARSSVDSTDYAYSPDNNELHQLGGIDAKKHTHSMANNRAKY